MTIGGYNYPDWVGFFLLAGVLCRVIKSIVAKELFLRVDQEHDFTR